MDNTVNPARSAYGLRIQSEIELSDLPVVSGEPDVRIATGRVEIPNSDCDVGEYAWGWCWCNPSRHVYGFSEVGRFEVNDGRAITIDPISNVDSALLRHVLLGPIFAGLLLQRNYLPLHANSQEIDKKVIGLVGPSGIGKSTLSAALYARNHPLISDDILATKTSDSAIIVPTGIPRIKLNPDISEFLNLDVPSDERIYPDSEKRPFLTSSKVDEDFRKLDAIYAIENGIETKIEQIEPKLAIIQLLGHVYRPDVVSSTLGRQELFQRCAQLAARVPIFTFSRPNDLRRLDESTQTIEQHIASLSSNDG